ncbi:hypothetical protein TM902_430004 [Tenacibaculum maritimum]|uniref:hypothetical protein n=1 Tax=Tenacibaculum maritimum TaxID=107401 RepID=UPI0012E5E78E|nr:hypothetical protein [Tenacibaculum maritimum]CAA0170965.1 hypothetical protein JIP32914_150003 [Tenacibaculum maritimum]CAA0172223.1 hypothetical protein TM902_430004 [Tenacibaculum maritimum]CAA0199326.1 hypothetical protein TMP445_450002 [Tenacibaculum maritimum]
MGKTTGIISFDSGRGNTIEIALIEVLKPFRIDLEANNTDRKDGVFGFDTIPKKRIVEKNYDKLKQEYKPLTQKILGEEYIPSWLSIRKEQTVELELDWSKKRRAKDYTTISFEEHKDFTFEPKNLKDAKTVKITCNNTSETSAQILIKANSELVVGALNIFYKKPKNIDLEWCFVETQGNNIDYEKLKKGIKKEDLKKHIKKGLNPALIDINISNNNPQIVDLSVYTERLKQRGIIASNDLVGSYIVNSKKNNFIGAISMKQNESVNKLNLYFINLKCVNPNNIKEEGGFDLIGGFSPIGTGKAYVVLDDNNDIIPENIVHELMHGLGLRHTFEGTYNYKDYKTDNYMDYKNNKRHTYKWQWEKLHEYEKLK